MKVSIIIPVYNVSDYIKECIDSVILQKGDIECIVVNDCTQDDSMLILKDSLKDYSGNIVFKIIEHSKNQGLSAARNTGIKAARGDYLFFLDSDDKLPEKSIEKMVSCLRNNEFPCCVIGDYEILGTEKIGLPKNDINLNLLLGNAQVLRSYLECQWYPMAWNKLVLRKFILDHALFFRAGMLHEDELWSYQLALNISSIQFCHDSTYSYRIRENSITKKRKFKNFHDNLLYCEFISKNILDKFEQETYIFLQNRLNGILLEMCQNQYSIDEIWNMAKHIKSLFGVHCYWKLKWRNFVNIIRCSLLYNHKNILRLYLFLCHMKNK